jgi:hypothetical protein
MKHTMKFVVGVLILSLAACGSSPEQIATMTASAWTPTPPPTATPTPVPYDVNVSIVDESGAPIAGANIVFPESGNGEPVQSDEQGKFSWTNLAGEAATFKLSAQGYLPAEQTVTLQRGANQVSIALKRDPFAFLPSNACVAGESLLYMEDFQDGQTDMAHHDGAPAPLPLGETPDETGNRVIVHDFTMPKGDYSSYLTANKTTGGFYEFGDAVWRMRFVMTQETTWNLSWNSARAAEFGGITTSESGYGIGFNTNRHIAVSRMIWDASGQRVFNVGKPDLVDKVLILKPNVWHYLEISTYLGQLQVWLDGASVVDVVDDMPLPPGGFSIGKGDTGIMYFDAISVCGLSAPFISMPSSIPAP